MILLTVPNLFQDRLVMNSLDRNQDPARRVVAVNQTRGQGVMYLNQSGI